MSKIIGERIKIIRKENGISILELSIKSGISKERMKIIESGEKSISVEELNSICKSLNITRKKLLNSNLV